MKAKKKYLIPAIAVVEIESESILAGSEPGGQKKVEVSGDDFNTSEGTGIGWGGTTKSDGVYSPD